VSVPATNARTLARAAVTARTRERRVRHLVLAALVAHAVLAAIAPSVRVPMEIVLVVVRGDHSRRAKAVPGRSLTARSRFQIEAVAMTPLKTRAEPASCRAQAAVQAAPPATVPVLTALLAIAPLPDGRVRRVRMATGRTRPGLLAELHGHLPRVRAMAKAVRRASSMPSHHSRAAMPVLRAVVATAVHRVVRAAAPAILRIPIGPAVRRRLVAVS
jgi:hypothetical protein